MSDKAPYLTKSRYVEGIRCERLLWLTHNDERPKQAEAEVFSAIDIGNKIGIGAHNLFPGGILVEAGPGRAKAALVETAKLMADPSIPSIFEAAFEYSGIYIRVDILERLEGGTWGLREVKATTKFKTSPGAHLDDVAVQLYVLQGVGLNVSSVQLIHINNKYDYQGGPVDWREFLNRADATEAASDHQDEIRATVPKFIAILGQDTSPMIEPSKKRCLTPHACQFWGQCSESKPDDWIEVLPKPRGKAAAVWNERIKDWAAQGINAIKDISDTETLPDIFVEIRSAAETTKPLFRPGLRADLANFGPAAYYLDFETISPVIPIYPGTRPYQQKLAFQWSIHHLDAANKLHHYEFLAKGDLDPRRDVAQTLVDVLSGNDIPILVYHAPMEIGVIEDLAEAAPDLAEPLLALLPRIRDLLPVIRNNVVEPNFFTKAALKSSAYSLKNVLPVLVPHVPELNYSNLEGVANGGDAMIAFQQIIAGEAAGQDMSNLREMLLKYCHLDTLAMVEMHRVLRDRVADLAFPAAAGYVPNGQ